MNKVLSVYSGEWKHGHCQGIALDQKNGCMYFSFTTALVKVALDGTVIGSATGLRGHLGCIAMNERDGRIYGSLEYKNDAIGRGILNMLGDTREIEDAFYIARFDGDKMTRVGMDACDCGIMETAYLRDVYDDYAAMLPDGRKHRYGCSGIDGLTFAPLFGQARDGEKFLCVAYGVYGEDDREDNDHQVILCYDQATIEPFFAPFAACAAKKDSPAPHQKLFALTGNTHYGVQNMEYDAHTGHVLLAVYKGSKPKYRNPPMFALDGTKAPKMGALQGVPGENGLLLSLVNDGIDFPYGATGMCSQGDGTIYFSHDRKENDTWSSTARLYAVDQNFSMRAL